MTIDEAIYCLKSYDASSSNNMCLKCKYYGSVEIDEQTSTCISSEARKMAIEALKEQRTGEWVNDGDYVPQCSECGYVPSYIKTLDKFDRSDWCPNCGARMEVEHE